MYDVAGRWCGWDRMRFHHHRFFRAHQYPRSAFTMINLPCGSSRTRRCLGMSGRGEAFSQTFSTFDASVSERPLTELRDFPSCSAVSRPSPPYCLSLTPSFSFRSVRKEVVARRGCAMWRQERVRGFIDPPQGRLRGENPVTSEN